MGPLHRDEVRSIDRAAIEQLGMSGLVLMENAGRNAANFLCELTSPCRVAICCGTGNNGGDGLVLARHLLNLGFDTHVLLFAPPSDLSEDSAANFRIYEVAGNPHSLLEIPRDETELKKQLSAADWIVDGLLGTGLSSNPREPFATVIGCMNATGRPILALDVPSGLNCETGQLGQPTVEATATATFVCTKTGFDTPTAQRVLGQVRVCDIGVPRGWLREWVDSMRAENAANQSS